MDFLILGPIAVRGVAGDVSLGGNKPRAVLAVLLLNANQPVSAERLALALWGEDAPGGAVKTVQVHVSRLRKALGDPDVLMTTRAGYTLRVREGELDAERFEELVEEARQAMADGQAEEAAAILRMALALWRGPALAELTAEPFAAAEIARLHEQRVAALELRVEADLEAGRHAEVVGELQQLVDDNPLRERLAAHLMLALYRCGRQTEALEAYAATRRTLVDEMGIEPGPDLRTRQEAILRQDSGLQGRPADAQLPAALDPSTAQPLVGREEELGWLLERWQLARNGGGGRLVALAGPRGAGKTRLAAELARAVHRPGVTVLHASGDGPADSMLVALRRAREATQPTLLVLDDVDRAGEGVRTELARIAPRLADVAVLVVAAMEAPATLAPVQPAGVLELGPIDAEAVREIAARYAPGRSTADVPAQWLLEASAGMPRRVHEAASQWARREAARHVGAVADRAETGRAELRTLEAELAGGIADLQEGRQRFDPGRREDAPVVCPFKGLATFDAADARYFYGRERLVAELVARLVGAPLLGIVGPSGSGKSSVMRAGLLPALATGVLPGSDTWPQVVMRPGRHPLRELAAALAGVEGERRTVLAIDQFEETFTVCDDEDERAEFISEVVHAALDPRGRYLVVLALRADCYGACAAHAELPALIAENHVLVGALTRDELRRAIEGPCERARLSIEPELVAALVDDVEREPGGLPLLSASLLELWQHRDGRRLRHSTYARTGGVHGAVARLAEDAFAQLDASRQAVGRSVLMRLVGTGEGDTVERRRVALDDLGIARDEDAARVVALLTDRRLLTVGAGSVELAHEALLREWPRLRGWIDEDRDGLRIQRGLVIAAAEWDRLGRDDSALLRGARLAEAAEWRDERAPRLSELEQTFLAAGEAAHYREQVTRRRRTRLVLGAGGMLVVAVVAVAVAALFASRERAIAGSRDLAARAASLAPIDASLGFALARDALERHDTEQAEDALRQATFAHRQTAVAQVAKGDAYVYVAEPSPDGRSIVTAAKDGTVRTWQAGSLAAQRTLATYKAPAVWATWTPDGKSVVSASYDGTVALTPAGGGPSRPLLRLAGGKDFPSMVAAARGLVVVATSTGAVRAIPTIGGAKPYVVGRHPGEGSVVAVAVDAGSTKVVSATDSGSTLLWDVASRSPVTLPVAAVTAGAAFRPGAKSFVTAHDDGRLRQWDASTGAPIGKPLKVDDNALTSVRFARDGHRVVVTGADGFVRVADLASRQVLSDMTGGKAWFAAFVPGSESVVSVSSSDGALRQWQPLRVRTPLRSGVLPSYSSDGTQIVSSGADGGVQLWDLARGERSLEGHEGPSTAAISPDGTFVASVSWDGSVRVHDLRAGTSRDLDVPLVQWIAVAISKANRVAIGGGAGPILVMDRDGGNLVELPVPGPTYALAFSPDGTRLLSGSADGNARVWDLRTRKARVVPADAEAVRGVAWQDDASHFATAGADGTVRIWPAGGGDAVVLVGHTGPVNTAEFNHRGDRIVSTGLDGSVRVWDTAGGATLVVLHQHVGAAGSGADFAPNGRDVVSAGADGMRITPCEVCGSLRDVQRLGAGRAKRTLSAGERQAGEGS
jgi:WD40 repeat protein/DNA-binding SARP family transcriptional activator/energy-coupling factor transporter ATP-binding protein EcfA2